ncbi:MAG: hydrogenase, partial [Acidobacteria bacterium]|nr:hydrogenase [Candidatus Sulfomarinibacter sp. MAG AM2]
MQVNTLSYLDNTGDDPAVRARLVVGDNDFHSVTEQVCGVVERPQPRIWWVVFAISSSLTL